MTPKSPFFAKAATVFAVTSLIALILNYVGSLFFLDELSLNWPIIFIVGLLAALCSYLSSLRVYVVGLEKRLSDLERRLNAKK